MGKSSSTVIGYRYLVAFFHGLAGHEIDALLEFGAAEKTAWAGRAVPESNGVATITINQPNLFGGDKDQGGIVGDADIQFGSVGQMPNAYLLATFGAQTPGWEDVTTFVYKGGQYGSMNPYQQKPRYKIQAILKGWDNDTCWYPEKAPVPMSAQVVSDSELGPTSDGWRYLVVASGDTANYSADDFDDSGWDVGQTPFAGGGVHPYAEPQGFPPIINTAWPLNTNLWLRRTFNIDNPLAFGLILFVDNYATVWVNGLLVLPRVGTIEGFSGPAFTHQVNVPADILRTGDNTLAVLCEDYGVYSYAAFKVDTNGSSVAVGMNPAHVLYEARTARHRGQEPTASMADASWRAGADWFFDQGFGICPTYDPDSESTEDFIARISKLANCAVNLDPTDGLWYLDIANGVYNIDDLPILTDDDILEISDSPKVLDDVVNSVAVEYYDPLQWRKITTRPTTALALISANGLNHQVNAYPEVPTADLANRLADRDLADFITPTHVFQITTTRKTYSWRRNTYFRLQAPKKGIADMVCLLAEKSDGTLKSSAIQITAAQDIYGLATTSFMGTEPGVDTRPPQTPTAIVNQAAVEAPYIEVARNLPAAELAALSADVGFILTAAKDPTGSSRDYTLMVATDGTNYSGSNTGHWCPSALIVEGDDLSGAAPVTDFTLSAGVLLDQVEVGMAALWGGEFCRVDEIDIDSNTLTLGRGCADTLPKAHAASSRIFFYQGYSATDPTQYTDGETIDAKLLTNTGSQQLNLAEATPIGVTFDSRQARPYPPAGLTFNGWSWNDPSPVSGALTLAWKHRDRVTQADQLIDATAADVGPETGVHYAIECYDDTDTLLVSRNDIDGNTADVVLDFTGNARFVVYAIRDDLESTERYDVTVAYTPPGGTTESTITAPTWEPDEIIKDGGGA